MAVKAACARTLLDIFHKRLLFSSFSVQHSVYGRNFVSLTQHFLSPQPPKKPPGAFFKFYNDKTPEILKTNPSATIGERSKIASRMWRELDPDVKNKMKLVAKEDMQGYRMKYMTFLDGLTDQERANLRQQKQDKRKARATRKHKMELKKFGRPKYPANAFMLFVRSSRLERGSARPTEFVKGLVEYWKKMPQEEKDIYLDDAKAEKEKYRLDMLEWEERMKEMGRTDLIRRKSQKKIKPVTSTKAKKKTASTPKKPRTPRGTKKTTTAKTKSKAAATKPSASKSKPSAQKPSAKAGASPRAAKKTSGTTAKKVISKGAEE